MRPKLFAIMPSDHGADHQDRAIMLASSALIQVSRVPVAEVAWRRAAGVVDQDVGRGAGAQRRLPALFRVMSPGTVVTLMLKRSRSSAAVASSASRPRA